MADNNNAYIKVKLDQIAAREKALKKELGELDERRKAYSEQLVDEPKTQSSPKKD